jgi:low temperature requirement protein LtrA
VATAPTANHSRRRERWAIWLELFFDLVFVAAIAELSHNLSANDKNHSRQKSLIGWISV